MDAPAFLKATLEDFNLRGKLNSFEIPRVYKEHLLKITDIYSGIGYQYRTKFLGLGRNKKSSWRTPRMDLW